MPENEKEKFSVRIGWSNLRSGLHALQLSEFNDSFAFSASGRKFSKINDEFHDEIYGQTFTRDDVVASYLDLGDEQDENRTIRIFFTKNGEDLGQAFEYPHELFTDETNSTVFYPHILVKNVKFQCNFGQLVRQSVLLFFFEKKSTRFSFIQESPWSQIKNEFEFVQKIPLDQRIRLCEPIREKNDCQVIFLSGLPCVGKTSWSKKFFEENRNKNFNLINVESILQRMAVS